MKRIHVNASRAYDVCIERGILDELGAQAAALVRGRTAIVVSDTNVAPLYMERALRSLRGAGFSADAFVFPAGESSKCPETYIALLNDLSRRRLTRADALVALGGGVVGDLTGFAASTYLRGIAFIQIPTTLLSCVDSSVGGKTAIDLPSGKNQVGTFYQPAVVLCDPNLLSTLPPEVFADGCAEVIKHGMIGSRALLQRLDERHAREQIEYVLASNVEMKRDVVESDEFDTGRRALLNFGHTFAHSIEAASGYTVPHGRAVAMGMRLITRAAVEKELCPAECLTILERLLVRHGLPLHTDLTARQLAEGALSDKKRSGGTVTLVVPCEVGKSTLMPIPVTELIDWAEAGLKP